MEFARGGGAGAGGRCAPGGQGANLAGEGRRAACPGQPAVCPGREGRGAGGVSRGTNEICPGRVGAGDRPAWGRGAVCPRRGQFLGKVRVQFSRGEGSFSRGWGAVSRGGRQDRTGLAVCPPLLRRRAVPELSRVLNIARPQPRRPPRRDSPGTGGEGSGLQEMPPTPPPPSARLGR